MALPALPLPGRLRAHLNVLRQGTAEGAAEDFLTSNLLTPGAPRSPGESTRVELGDLMFSQDSISFWFQNGRPLPSLINDLKSGRLLPDALDIRVVQWEGSLHCLSNRRLYCLKKALPRSFQVRVRVVPMSSQIMPYMTFPAGPSGTGRDITVRDQPTLADRSRSLSSNRGSPGYR